MMLHLILIEHKGKVFSFKTTDALKQSLKCSMPPEVEEELNKCSLTSKIASVNIEENELVITGTNDIIRGQ